MTGIRGARVFLPNPNPCLILQGYVYPFLRKLKYIPIASISSAVCVRKPKSTHNRNPATPQEYIYQFLRKLEFIPVSSICSCGGARDLNGPA